MKRLLFIIAMALCVASVNAQEIFTDKTNEEGTRLILTKLVTISGSYSFGNSCTIGMDYIAVRMVEPVYQIDLIIKNQDRMSIDVGRKLLLKFDDGSTMELSNGNKINLYNCDPDVHNGITSYKIRPYYCVTPEQIKDIASKNVVKIRVENDVKYIDYDIKDNKFSSNVGKMYDNIQAALSTENSIYTGF